jgi:hypothetical protein
LAQTSITSRFLEISLIAKRLSETLVGSYSLDVDVRDFTGTRVTLKKSGGSGIGFQHTKEDIDFAGNLHLKLVGYFLSVGILPVLI